MRIGILSDTHDKLARTIAAVARLQAEGAEALIHCGDLTGPEIVHACGVTPFYFVFGNNEYDFAGLKRAATDAGATCLDFAGELVLAGKRIAVVHGHLTRDIRPLAAKQPDYLLYGHSHLAADERRGATRWINPGALHRASEYTVAVLDLDQDEVRFLNIE